MSYVVIPHEVRLPLSDGHYLVVREHLTAGETQEMRTRMLGKDNNLNYIAVGVSLAAAYLIDWSIPDAQGQIIPIRYAPVEDVIAALHSFFDDKYQEIVDVIQAHDAKMRAAREEKKLQPAGVTTSAATSRSLVAVGGGMSGSPD